MLLLIDNYDSFTYNLVQYFQCLNQKVLVFPHDKVTIHEIERLKPDYLVISPGPKAPADAGISIEVILRFYDKLPILGICLGHQCLAHAFGAKIIQSPEIIHGKTSTILHHKMGLFSGLPNGFQATRYHSLTIDIETLPECFSIDAWANDSVMAISHRNFPLFGLQFHPEAILTEHGHSLLANFLDYEHHSPTRATAFT